MKKPKKTLKEFFKNKMRSLKANRRAHSTDKKKFSSTDGGGEGGTSGNWGGGATHGTEKKGPRNTPLTSIDALGTQHFNPQ